MLVDLTNDYLVQRFVPPLLQQATKTKTKLCFAGSATLSIQKVRTYQLILIIHWPYLVLAWPIMSPSRVRPPPGLACHWTAKPLTCPALTMTLNTISGLHLSYLFCADLPWSCHARIPTLISDHELKLEKGTKEYKNAKAYNTIFTTIIHII